MATTDRARWRGYKQAQKIFPLKPCICGCIDNLQRHHHDNNPLNNKPGNVAILCQDCHANVHIATKTWGRMNGKRKAK